VPILALPEDGLLKANDVIEFIRVGKSTWFTWVREGIAPQPVKIGCNTFWRAREIRAFIDGSFQNDSDRALPPLPARGRGGSHSAAPSSFSPRSVSGRRAA